MCVVIPSPLDTILHLSVHAGQSGSQRRKVSTGENCIFSLSFFCGARLNVYREKCSAVSIPRRIEFCSIANEWAAYVFICCWDVLAISQNPCVVEFNLYHRQQITKPTFQASFVRRDSSSSSTGTTLLVLLDSCGFNLNTFRPTWYSALAPSSLAIVLNAVPSDLYGDGPLS